MNYPFYVRTQTDTCHIFSHKTRQEKKQKISGQAGANLTGGHVTLYMFFMFLNRNKELPVLIFRKKYKYNKFKVKAKGNQHRYSRWF